MCLRKGLMHSNEVVLPTGAFDINDNEPTFYTNHPLEWVRDILDTHDIGLRTDNPHAAAVVLLTDAADLLKEARQTAFREQAVTSKLRQRVADITKRIGERLFALCPTVPAVGTLTDNVDGTLVWGACRCLNGRSARPLPREEARPLAEFVFYQLQKVL